MVYPVLRLGKIAVAVLVEVKMMVGAGDGGLGVGYEGVDPPDRLQVAGLPVSDNDRAVGSNLGTGHVKVIPVPCISVCQNT